MPIPGGSVEIWGGECLLCSEEVGRHGRGRSSLPGRRGGGWALPAPGHAPSPCAGLWQGSNESSSGDQGGLCVRSCESKTLGFGGLTLGPRIVHFIYIYIYTQIGHV